jgi:hypothetical protein
MASAYKLFANDKSTEQEGILINYGDFRLRIARAGGANQKFRRLLQAKLKPYRHQIDNDTMDEAVSEQLLRAAYAEAVILGWESRVETNGVETWEPWLETPDGRVEYSTAACVKVLNDLPELFRDVQTMAGKSANFRRAEEEEDAKN